ncbi:unnamed protein product [Durusdinium trenchii]|uniref:Uncharacterized protein n=1 Tax=Durusdinium trenchii TaxID=1381693 RepID=A0ABP0PSQ7_9DINO
MSMQIPISLDFALSLNRGATESGLFLSCGVITGLCLGPYALYETAQYENALNQAMETIEIGRPFYVRRLMIYLPIAGALLSLVSAVFVNETATSENTQMVWPFGGKYRSGAVFTISETWKNDPDGHRILPEIWTAKNVFRTDHDKLKSLSTQDACLVKEEAQPNGVVCEIALSMEDLKQCLAKNPREQEIFIASAAKRQRVEVKMKDLTPEEVIQFDKAKDKELSHAKIPNATTGDLLTANLWTMLAFVQIGAFIGPLCVVPGIIFWTKVTPHESKTFWMILTQVSRNVGLVIGPLIFTVLKLAVTGDGERAAWTEMMVGSGTRENPSCGSQLNHPQSNLPCSLTSVRPTLCHSTTHFTRVPWLRTTAVTRSAHEV